MTEKMKKKAKVSEKEKKEKKEKIELKILPGRKTKLVPCGIKLSAAAKEAGIQDLSQYAIVRLNGRTLKRNEKGELEDPILTENSILVLAEKIKGGD